MQSYFERFVAEGYDAKTVATWLVGPLARRCNEEQKEIDMLPF